MCSVGFCSPSSITSACAPAATAARAPAARSAPIQVGRQFRQQQRLVADRRRCIAAARTRRGPSRGRHSRAAGNAPRRRAPRSGARPDRAPEWSCPRRRPLHCRSRSPAPAPASPAAPRAARSPPPYRRERRQQRAAAARRAPRTRARASAQRPPASVPADMQSSNIVAVRAGSRHSAPLPRSRPARSPRARSGSSQQAVHPRRQRPRIRARARRRPPPPARARIRRNCRYAARRRVRNRDAPAPAGSARHRAPTRLRPTKAIRLRR